MAHNAPRFKKPYQVRGGSQPPSGYITYDPSTTSYEVLDDQRYTEHRQTQNNHHQWASPTSQLQQSQQQQRNIRRSPKNQNNFTSFKGITMENGVPVDNVKTTDPRALDNGSEFDYDANDEGDDEMDSAVPVSSSRTKGDHYVTSIVPSSTNVYFWGNFNVRFWQSLIPIFTIPEMLLVIIVLVFWALRLIPSYPPSFMHYAAIYYVAYPPIIPLNFSMSCAQSKMLYSLMFLLHIGLLTLTLWIIAIQWFQLIECWIGAIPSTCKNTELMDLIMAGITIGIGVIVFAHTVIYFILVARLRSAQTPSSISYYPRTVKVPS